MRGPESKEAIGARMRAWRYAKNLSQEDVGKISGKGRNYTSKWETGKVLVGPEFFAKVVDIRNYDWNYFYGGYISHTPLSELDNLLPHLAREFASGVQVVHPSEVHRLPDLGPQCAAKSTI